MPQTRQNKGVAPVNSDAYNLAPDLATLIDSLNVVIPVASQAERDALTKKAGLAVARTDLTGLPIERCDGTNWWNTQHSEWTFNQSGVPSGTVWGTNTLTVDSANSTDTTFVTCPSADLLTIRDAGTYAIHLMGKWGTANTGFGFVQITDSNGTNTWAVSPATANLSVLSTNIPNFRCGANTTIKLSCLITISGTTTWQGRVRITRIGY